MILITGGTGLLGSHLLLRLLQDGQKVRAIVSEEGKPEKALEVWKYYIPDAAAILENAEWFRTDISNKAKLSEAFEGIEKVYHCAALVTFDPRKKAEMINVNITGTRNIVDLSLENNIKKLVHVSSIAAVGNSSHHEEISEKDKWPVKSRSVYAKTKTDGELEVWRGIYEGLNAIIVNPSVILGPGLWQQSSARFFDVLYKGLKYYTSGATGFVDVEDVVSVMINLMSTEVTGERYILNGANLSYKILFEKIAKALNVKAPHKRASMAITSIAWRLEWLKSRLTGQSPLITRESAASSQRQRAYSAEKVKVKTGLVFHTIDDTISRIAELYLNEKLKIKN